MDVLLPALIRHYDVYVFVLMECLRHHHPDMLQAYLMIGQCIVMGPLQPSALMFLPLCRHIEPLVSGRSIIHSGHLPPVYQAWSL